MTLSIAFEIFRDERWQRTQRLPLDRALSVGSTGNCDVVLIGDGVAAWHAFVLPLGASVRVVACNGYDFRIGGMPVRETLAVEQGRFEVGPYQIAFAVEVDPDETDEGAADDGPTVGSHVADDLTLDETGADTAASLARLARVAQPAARRNADRSSSGAEWPASDATAQELAQTLPSGADPQDDTRPTLPDVLGPLARQLLAARAAASHGAGPALSERPSRSTPARHPPSIARETPPTPTARAPRPPAAEALETTARAMPAVLAPVRRGTGWSMAVAAQSPTPAVAAHSSGPSAPLPSGPALLAPPIMPRTSSPSPPGRTSPTLRLPTQEPPSTRLPPSSPAASPSAPAPDRDPDVTLGALLADFTRLTTGATVDGRADRLPLMLLLSVVVHALFYTCALWMADEVRFEAPSLTADDLSSRFVQLRSVPPPELIERLAEEEIAEQPRPETKPEPKPEPRPQAKKERPAAPAEVPTPVAAPAGAPRSNGPNKPPQKLGPRDTAAARAGLDLPLPSAIDLGDPPASPSALGGALTTMKAPGVAGPTASAAEPFKPTRVETAQARPVVVAKQLPKPTVGGMGGASAEERGAIEAGMSGKRARFGACYDQATGRNPNLNGRLIVKFEIQPDGRATTTEGELHGATDRELVECFKREIAQIRFERTARDVILVTYSWVLRNQ